MNKGGGREGRGLVWFDRFLGRPDRQSAGGGSRPLAFGSLTHARGRDILICDGKGQFLASSERVLCGAEKANSYNSWEFLRWVLLANFIAWPLAYGAGRLSSRFGRGRGPGLGHGRIFGLEDRLSRSGEGFAARIAARKKRRQLPKR